MWDLLSGLRAAACVILGFLCQMGWGFLPSLTFFSFQFGGCDKIQTLELLELGALKTFHVAQLSET